MKKATTKPPVSPAEYISVQEYASTQKNRRGFTISPSYVWRMIREHKDGKRETLPFEYVEFGQIIRIVKPAL